VQKELTEFGCEELAVVMSHFADVLQDKIDRGEVDGEWLQLKLYVHSHMQHLKAHDCWSSLSQGKTFGNVMKVINLLCIVPVSNAVLERCFSTMGKVKTDWRNRLGEKEVEHLVHLKKEGPELGSPEAQILIQAAADSFFNTFSARYELSRTILVLAVCDVRDNSYCTAADPVCAQRQTNSRCRAVAIQSTATPSGE